MIVLVTGLVESPPVFASGQMKLDGLLAVLLLMVLAIQALLVVVLMLFKVFRWRAIVFINTVLSVVWMILGISIWKDFQYLVAGISKAFGGGIGLLALLAVLLVVLFIIWMPLRQYRISRIRFEA